jgi:hypothetical protein
LQNLRQGNVLTSDFSCIFEVMPSLISGMAPTDKISEFFNKTREGLWLCRACGFTEKHKSNIQTHVESKHYSPWYPCRSNCGKSFKLRNSRCQHEKACAFRLHQ